MEGDVNIETEIILLINIHYCSKVYFIKSTVKLQYYNILQFKKTILYFKW